MENDGKMSFIDQNLSNLMLDVFHSCHNSMCSFFPPLWLSLLLAVCEFSSLFGADLCHRVYLMCVIWWNNSSKMMFSFCQSIKLLTKEITQNKYFLTNNSRELVCVFLCVFFSRSSSVIKIVRIGSFSVMHWVSWKKFPFISTHNEYLNTLDSNNMFLGKNSLHTSGVSFVCFDDDDVIQYCTVQYNQWDDDVERVEGEKWEN